VLVTFVGGREYGSTPSSVAAARSVGSEVAHWLRH
jgi:hypothetical protein